MANVVYECSVNKSHSKRDFVTAPIPAPMCCGKTMTKVQAAAQQPVPPAAQPQKAATQPAKK